MSTIQETAKTEILHYQKLLDKTASHQHVAVALQSQHKHTQRKKIELKMLVNIVPPLPSTLHFAKYINLFKQLVQYSYK
jgi:hypothetical protein